MQVTEMLAFIADYLKEKGAQDVQQLSMPEKAITKYMVVATGRSTKNIGFMADDLSMQLRNKFNIDIALEGTVASPWAVVDANDVMVHIMHPDQRAAVALEDLWKR